jgi:hypothetical protein
MPKFTWLAAAESAAVTVGPPLEGVTTTELISPPVAVVVDGGPL